LAVLHESLVHVLPSLQFASVWQQPAIGAPWHEPPLQASLLVQMLASLHVVPSAFAGFEQTPVCVSQLPTRWHWSEAVQTTGFEPVHVPD
jgi:hypothetical protein